jgi:hypothetical protein
MVLLTIPRLQSLPLFFEELHENNGIFELTSEQFELIYRRLDKEHWSPEKIFWETKTGPYEGYEGD